VKKKEEGERFVTGKRVVGLCYSRRPSYEFTTAPTRLPSFDSVHIAIIAKRAPVFPCFSSPLVIRKLPGLVFLPVVHCLA
jgi:hypothetical protein